MLQIESPLVTVDWLQDNLEAENLIVLDATIQKVAETINHADSTYIPKSQFFDIKKKFSDVEAEFSNTIPSEEQFQTEARNLGVNTGSAIVIYDHHGIYSSARAWCLFKHFGHTNVAVLDGGLPEWISKGFKTSDSYIENRVEGNFTATSNSNLFTDFEGLKSYSELDNTQIIDARSRSRFLGETPEPREGLRSGIIPSSVNLPYPEVLDGNILKSTKELKSIFNALIKSNKKLVFSCGSGITACNLALAATLIGHKNIVVYDGSWTEYGTLTD